MHVVIFEGSRWADFAPLSLSRPVFMLHSGLGPLLQKQIRCLAPTRLSLWVRPALAEWCRQWVVPGLGIPTTVNQPLNDEPAMLVNGRTLFFNKFEYPDSPAMTADEGQWLRHAYVKSPGLSSEDMLQRTSRSLKLLELPETMPQGRVAQYPWDLISWNEESLVEDSLHLESCARVKPAGPYHVVNDQNVCLGDNVKLEPGVVLDGSKGPVIVAKGALIGANSVLQGPCYVGPSSEIAPLSLIRQGVSIGPVCKVGGEVSNSIIHGYSNKAHVGYLGDSYLGKWVNLGAATTTSNLKNTRGAISMQVGSRKIETDRRKLGSIIGDHAKTAINTRLNTGTYVGFSAMAATSEALPHFIPSFSFWTDGKREKYRPEKAKEVMAAFFAARQRTWGAVDDQVLAYVQQVVGDVEK